MTSSAVQQLHVLLVQDEEQRRQDEKELKSRRALLGPMLPDVDTVWRTHGVLSPSTGYWRRPIPSILFRCPVSAPQTTLVPWSSLPQAVRSKLTTPEGEDAVVEVPLSYLAPEDEDTAISSSGTLQRRPLGGNLTSKLTEYTRGVAGQCKPFRPGGMDDTNLAHPISVDDGLLHDILIAKKVLDKGSTASWRDGSLVTAPPGVSFQVGLTWVDVYEDDVPKGIDEVESEEETGGDKVYEEKVIQEDSKPSLVRPTQAGMWEKSFFDDDSLFGDSSESVESSSDEEVEDEDVMSIEQEEIVDESLQSLLPTAKTVEDLDTGITVDATCSEDIDALLAELSISDYSASAKRKEVVSNNPLELAKQQSQLAQDTSRKSWADIKLLPIKDFNSYIPNPAMTFPFTLDNFQQQAVARLERSESIFVAAHTSAGKTVCAEYAVSLCQQHCTRAVYTSPIKALSNQKFRDFCTKFGAKNVGLITGDMQVNADDSTVLIMTTEILRSMLYRGADMIRDIEWVIFDEVHYVNDTERGVVWEEVIIMLPPYVNMIFLSATTPNTIDFSDWIGRTKRKPVHVIRTNYRPVPLSHFLWAGLKLHKTMEGKGGFLDKGYSEASKALLPAATANKGKDSMTPRSAPSRGGSKQLAWQAQGTKQNWMSLIKFLDREGLSPAVVFSFSKKKCEEIAHMLRSLDLNTSIERSSVHAFTAQTVARLSPLDATLPQVLTICEMVKRGIGVHHGGLLPILKEMVEILFSRNLIKVLFATETFAMGVNMPCRCVVFNSIRKHDGTQFRVLEPGEYTQMAGRAGRRGLDRVGTVIMCCFGDMPPPMPILRNLLTGSSTRLSSQFRLTYNMILNLLRVEDMSVEGMIKRSFSEFATQRALTANEYPRLVSRGVKTLAKLDEQFKQDANNRIGAEDLEDYFNVCSELKSLNADLLLYIVKSVGSDGGGAFIPGRVMLVNAARKNGCVRSPGILLRQPVLPGSSSGRSGEGSGPKPAAFIVLLPESYIASIESSEAMESRRSGKSDKPETISYVGTSRNRYYAIHEVDFNDILVVSSTKHNVDTNALLKEDTQATSAKSEFGGHLSKLDDPFANAVPVSRRCRNDFDAFAGMKAKGKTMDSHITGSSSASAEEKTLETVVCHLIEAEKRETNSNLQVMDLRDCVRQGNDLLEFRQQCSRMEELVIRMRNFSSHRHPNIEGHFAALERKETLRSRVETLRHLLSNESLQLFPDFLQRKSLLLNSGYIDDKETVCVKGRVACEVNTCDELIVTEMVLEGILNNLQPAEIVAALSALVFQEKNNEDEFDAELPEQLVMCCQQMKTIASNLGQLQKDHGLEIDPADYCDASLKFGLVHVVYEWALGVPFSSICELTLVQEGSIVRCITRLDELCREVRNCARVVGNPTLYRKMEEASMAIKRDIVFASSLYVS